MNTLVPPFIPESAPFNQEQRAWLNGFLAGMCSGGAPDNSTGPAPAAGGGTANGSGRTAGPLLIGFGSQTGTAEGLARQLAKEAARRGYIPKIQPLNDIESASLAAAAKAVIISSTWGDGDPPDNATGFWTRLQDGAAPRLESLEFAVLGLGDKNYSDFCGASKKMDDRLAALGARRLVPRGECDTDYEAAARQWMEGLWEKIGAGHAPSTAGAESVPAAAVLQSTPAVPAPGFSKAHPFPARLLKRVALNRPGSAKETWHFEIALGRSGLTYAVGDALGVLPENCPELVAAVVAALGGNGDEPVAMEAGVAPLQEALTRHLDLGRPGGPLLAEIARRAPDVEFAPLLAPERAEDLKRWLHGRDVLDVLGVPGLAPGAPNAGWVLPLLRKLAPRLYSISSSPKAHPGEVHLTVGAVRYEARERARKGAASTWLAERAGGTVKVFIQPSHGFRPPEHGDTPMIMVGPGTGIAPFRAFLEEREATGAGGKNWLFFGDQRRATDFLYEAQLTRWQQSGFLTRLDLAFSRDQAEKVYVQDRMREQGPELWAWLEAGAHFYLCGDASRMARDVDAALQAVVEQAGGKSSADARAYVEQLKAARRYQRDVY